MFKLFLGEASSRRLSPDVSRVVNQLIVTVLQGNVVLIVAQMLWLKRVDSLVIPNIVQLVLIFNSYLLLTSFLFLVV